MVGDELLSAFKVASFAFDEEKAVMEVKKESTEEESRDWVWCYRIMNVQCTWPVWWKYPKCCNLINVPG